jgi:hypothetical protein
MHPEPRPNPDRRTESLEARLRALPQPSVPADLEARLLATVPAKMPAMRRQRKAWFVAAGALAAACVLAVLIWRGNDGTNSIAIRPIDPVTPQPQGDIAPTRLEVRQSLDETKMPAFSWPLDETVPIHVSPSIPSALFD